MDVSQGGSCSVMGSCWLDLSVPFPGHNSTTAVEMRRHLHVCSHQRWFLRTEVPLQKPEGPLLTKAGGLSINKWEIMILITSSLVLIELS